MFASISKRLRSFIYAFRGIWIVAKSQPNFIIHIIAAIVAIACGIILGISTYEWLAVIIVIGVVLTAEVINSAIEDIVNFISPDKNQLAGKIKDMAAGAVLLAAIMALLVGIIIFLPKILILL